METSVAFENAGEPWSQKEESLLNKLYNEDALGIMEISRIHRRAPGGILSKLKLLKYITQRQTARGYDLYKKSKFYKQLVQNNKVIYKKNLTETLEQTIQTAQIENASINIHKNECINIENDANEMKNEIKELKNEIKELKNSIKELVEMMKAVYEFENL